MINWLLVDITIVQVHIFDLHLSVLYRLHKMALMTGFEATFLALLLVIAWVAVRLSSHGIFIAHWLLELTTYSHNLSRTLMTLIVVVFILHFIIIILK